MDKGNNVTVQLPELHALGRPNFVIEHDGKLYLAVAVLEYDPKAARTPEQQRGIALVREMFEKAVAEKPVKAGEVCLMSAAYGMNTNFQQS